jgi:hypothetical protein
MTLRPATEPDRHRPTPRRRLALAAALGLLAGCNGVSSLEHDPLLGGPPVSKVAPAGAAASPAAQAAAPAPGAVPPLPSTHVLNSPAALVGGITPVPDAGRDPRPGTTTAGAALQGIEPLGSGARPAAGAPGGPPAVLTSSGPQAIAAAANPADAYLQLQEMLKARGVTWQRLEVWGDRGEWRFICSVPNPQQRFVNRNYEARAAGDYGLAAMRAVIEQIDAEKGLGKPPS